MTDLKDNAPAAELIVFMSPECPHCGRAVKTARSLVRNIPAVHLRVVDAQKEPEMAASYSVKSVPTTILDGEVTWVGVVSAGDLKAAINSRGGSDFARLSFVSLIENGRMDRAIERLVEGSGTAPFLDAWKQSTTSVRIGLMLAATQALDMKPHAMDEIVPRLLPVLQSDDVALRGDTADLLGEVGHPDAKEEIKALLGDPNPDVAEIAADALESITSAKV